MVQIAHIPLALYIHFPWCIRKCPYCDFNSHTAPATIPEMAYIDTLIKDLEQDLTHIENRPINSVFFGGGTPSLFSAKAIQSLLQAIQARLTFAPNIEITLEANPGTVEQTRFAEYREVGINRLSLGIQSFQADKLQSLGRIHDHKAAHRAVTMAKNAGFTNFNIDLMYGLPQQTHADALYDLQTALDLQPPHLSWYQLTIELNTFFHHRPPQLPDEDHIVEIETSGIELLAAHGLKRYEVSAYSLQNHACQHNLNYWQFGDYLGIGAGAHSKITDATSGIIQRFWKNKNPKTYLDSSSFIGDKYAIDTQTVIFEFMLNALRLNQRISAQLFEERTGLCFSTITKQLQTAQQKGLLIWDETGFEKTTLGANFLNDLVAVFMPA